MSFTLAKDPLKVWWPVTIPVPFENGTTKDHKIKLLFEVLPLSVFGEFEGLIQHEGAAAMAELDRILDGYKTGNADDEDGTEKGDDEVQPDDDYPGHDDQTVRLLMRVSYDWQDVDDENGKAIPFDRKAYAQFLDISYVRPAVLQAYMGCMAGRRLKN